MYARQQIFWSHDLKHLFFSFSSSRKHRICLSIICFEHTCYIRHLIDRFDETNFCHLLWWNSRSTLISLRKKLPFWLVDLSPLPLFFSLSQTNWFSYFIFAFIVSSIVHFLCSYVVFPLCPQLHLLQIAPYSVFTFLLPMSSRLVSFLWVYNNMELFHSVFIYAYILSISFLLYLNHLL